MSWLAIKLVFFALSVGMGVAVVFAVWKVTKDKPFPDSDVTFASPEELNRELALVSVGRKANPNESRT